MAVVKALAIIVLLLGVVSAIKQENITKPLFCPDDGGCTVGGTEGACVSVSGGCCSGTTTAGYCPGSSDIECCTNNPCSTPQGSGTCISTSACSGTAVAGYCAGPSDLQCCISGGPPSGCTVGSVGGCDSTTPISGLTQQIINQLGAQGYSFRGLDQSLVHCDDCECSLQNDAADALEKAASSMGDYITINDGFRSCAQQYLLYQWYQAGQCGITLAAAPGSSNHESGRAIDTSYYNYWLDTLQNYGWTWSYPDSDPVHFDYLSSPDISQQNLLAFQQLWNQNNPNSQISEDGIYGPETANAISNAPCGGW